MLFAGGTRILIPVMVCLLAGCGALPQSGPSAKDILDFYAEQGAALGARLIDLTPETVVAANAIGYPRSRAAVFPAASQPVDTARVGDILSVVLFQVGPGIFASGGGGTAAPAASAGSNISATSVALPPLVVGRDGTITVPYGGRLAVVGKTVHEIENLIANSVKQGVYQPQVVLNIQSSDETVFTILGDVKSAGRYKLSLGERLLDGLAMAGGPAHADLDEIISLFRGTQTFSSRLSAVESSTADNVALEPADRVQVAYDPLTFSVLGATGKIQEITFDRKRITMAEAVARTAGPSDQLADIAGMFLFRVEPQLASAPAQKPVVRLVPVIYHLDLANPQSYFMMQRLEMHDKDILYIADARAVQIKKFFQLIGALFQPVAETHVIVQ